MTKTAGQHERRRRWPPAGCAAAGPGRHVVRAGPAGRPRAGSGRRAAAAGILRGAPGHARRVGADGDATGLASRRLDRDLPRRRARQRLGERRRRAPRRSGRASRRRWIAGRVVGDVVAPDRRLGGERRPHVDVVVGCRRRRTTAAGAMRGISPVGGSVQCGSGPVSLGPKLSRRSPVSSDDQWRVAGSRPGTADRRTLGGRAARRSRRRHLSSLIALPCHPLREPLAVSSHLEQLGLLAAERGVDRLDVLVGDLLELLLRPLQLVGRDLALLSSCSRCLRASRRRLRTATRPSSAMCLTTLTYSLRRSSVSGGKTRRIADAVVARVTPRSESMDRPLDRGQRAAVVRTHEELAGLRAPGSSTAAAAGPACRSSRR